MKYVTTLVLCFALFNAANAQKTKTKPTKSEPKTMDVKLNNAADSTSYSLGVLIGKNLKNQGFEDMNIDLFMKAVKDVMTNQPTQINDMQAQTFVQKYQQNAQKIKAEKNLKEGQEFLAKNKTKPGVKVTESGLQYEVLKEGDGSARPTANSEVTAHYHGTLINGTVFDSSVNRGQPFKTKVGQVIKAWQEALQMMTPGMKLRIYCPSELAYGERGAGGSIGPNQVLIFEMELLSIDKP